jgi:hypothetical protein
LGGQRSLKLIGMPEGKGIEELVPALARASSSEGAEAGSPAGPAVDETHSSVRNTRSTVSFWSLQALMFGSAVAAAETTHNCIQSGSCTAIPTQFRTRSAMYNVGLPMCAGIAILSYEMKKHGNRWWFLPSSLVIAADGLLTLHSARASQ